MPTNEKPWAPWAVKVVYTCVGRPGGGPAGYYLLGGGRCTNGAGDESAEVELLSTIECTYPTNICPSPIERQGWEFYVHGTTYAFCPACVAEALVVYRQKLAQREKQP